MKWWKLKKTWSLLLIIFILALALVASIMAFCVKKDLVKPEVKPEAEVKPKAEVKLEAEVKPEAEVKLEVIPEGSKTQG